MQHGEREKMLLRAVGLAGLVYILSLQIGHPGPRLLLILGLIVLVLTAAAFVMYTPSSLVRRLFPPWLRVTCRVLILALALYFGVSALSRERPRDRRLEVILALMVVVAAAGLFSELRKEPHLRRLLGPPPRPPGQ